MSGFQVINDAGAVILDSDNKPTYFERRFRAAIPITGDFSFDTVFGNINQLGWIQYSQSDLYYNGLINWVQFDNGGWGAPGACYFQSSGVWVIQSNRSKAIRSGYLDVFSSDGELIWSALSAATMPRVRGLITVPPGFDLLNNTYTQYIGFNPYILASSCPGNFSDDGGNVGFNALIMKYENGTVYLRWINRNQMQWSSHLQATGLKIPYATFIGY